MDMDMNTTLTLTLTLIWTWTWTQIAPEFVSTNKRMFGFLQKMFEGEKYEIVQYKIT
jgi:hypothetical protein